MQHAHFERKRIIKAVDLYGTRRLSEPGVSLLPMRLRLPPLWSNGAANTLHLHTRLISTGQKPFLIHPDHVLPTPLQQIINTPAAGFDDDDFELKSPQYTKKRVLYHSYLFYSYLLFLVLGLSRDMTRNLLGKEKKYSM